MPGPDDPSSPDYVPRGDGDTGRDLGSGERFGLDLYALYSAGRLHMPATAEQFSAAASEMHYALGVVSSVADRLGHSAVLLLSQQVEEVQEALSLTARRIYAAADSMVAMADDFASTDQAAAEYFRTELDSHRDAYTGLPPHDIPPLPEDPQVSGPRHIPPEDEVGDIVDEAELPNPYDVDDDGIPNDEDDDYEEED